MKTINKSGVLWSVILLFCCCPGNLYADIHYFSHDVSADKIDSFLGDKIKVTKEIKIDLMSLLLSYPDYCKGVETREGKLYIIMSDGSKVLYDDHLTKTFDQKLDNPDMKNMLEQVYFTGSLSEELAPNFDPGRIRVDSFLNSVYGNSHQKVLANSEPVLFCNQKLMFNKSNGASIALNKVWKTLEPLTKGNRQLYDIICPSAGTIASRNIEGTQRKSPHSFGIAIDLNTKKTFYWRWNKNNKEAIASIRQYPANIIKAFEDNGFIWGGKWNHYDSMHFEYRPELLRKQKMLK